LGEEHFGQLLALCQFLPGPASSQLCFSVGLLRAGWWGGFVAFLVFTLPSALLLFAFALWSTHLDAPWERGAVHGLKLVAVVVVVVAQGLLGMARALIPDRSRALMAAAAAGLVALSGSAWMQLLVIAGGAALGPWLCREIVAQSGETFTLHYGRRTGGVLLAVFGALLMIALVVAPHMPLMGQGSDRVAYAVGSLPRGRRVRESTCLRLQTVPPALRSIRRFLRAAVALTKAARIRSRRDCASDRKCLLETSSIIGSQCQFLHDVGQVPVGPPPPYSSRDQVQRYLADRADRPRTAAHHQKPPKGWEHFGCPRVCRRRLRLRVHP
jgi:chromate transport protein ChrA